MSVSKHGIQNPELTLEPESEAELELNNLFLITGHTLN